MKKAGVLLISLLLMNILVLSLISAQDMPVPIPGELDPETGLPKGVPKDIDEAKEKLETKWDYLGKEWRKIFLKNKIVSKVDAFLTKISVVFLILFGQPYSFSLTLLVIIVLWFYFLFKFYEALKMMSAFSSGTSVIISIALVVVMAQLQVLKLITEFFGWLIFTREAWWLRLLIFILLVCILILIYKLSSRYLEKLKKKKEEEEKEREKAERKKIIKTGEALGQI